MYGPKQRKFGTNINNATIKKVTTTMVLVSTKSDWLVGY